MASKICISSPETSAAAILKNDSLLAEVSRDEFLIELRLDRFSDLSTEVVDQLLDCFAGKVVITCRRADEGGENSNLTDQQRASYLILAIKRGVTKGPVAVDWELRSKDQLPQIKEALESIPEKDRPQLILSWHDFNCVPTNLEQVRLDMEAAGADIVKIAVMPKTVCESKPVLDLLIKEGQKPLIALAMGEAGLWTRVLAPRFNAPFTFARPTDATEATAPGQPKADELENLYRYFEQKPDWPVYGVIGNPIAHSLSPLFHCTALKDHNLPGVYLPFLVEDDPAEFVKLFGEGLNFQGLSVTIPHKEDVQQACTELSEAVKSIGACNTLTRQKDGSYHAENTDASSAADALMDKLGDESALQGKYVLLLGAGGAGKALAHGLKERGAELILCNRTRARAEEIAEAVEAEVIEFNDLPDAIVGKSITAVVNTTPLGMAPKTDMSPLMPDQIPVEAVVFDTIYNPLHTKLLQLAQEKGCEILDGTAMFVGQGARQFEMWTGKPAPKEKLAALLKSKLST